MAEQLGHFTGEAARERFQAAYDVAMQRWPKHEKLDIATGYGRNRVWRAGADRRPPLVLLHGASGTSANWWRMIGGLATERTVYAVDTIDDPGGSSQTGDDRAP